VRFDISAITFLLDNLDEVLEAVDFSRESEYFQSFKRVRRLKKLIFETIDEEEEREYISRESILYRKKSRLYDKIPLFECISSELSNVCSALYSTHVTKPIPIPEPMIHFTVNQFLCYLKFSGASKMCHLVDGADFALKSILNWIEVNGTDPELEKLKKVIVYLVSRDVKVVQPDFALVPLTTNVSLKDAKPQKICLIQDKKKNELKAQRKVYNMLCLTNRVVQHAIQNLSE